MAGRTEFTGRPLHLGELGVLAGGTWGEKHTQAGSDTLGASRSPDPTLPFGMPASSPAERVARPSERMRDVGGEADKKLAGTGPGPQRTPQWSLRGRGSPSRRPPPALQFPRGVGTAAPRHCLTLTHVSLRRLCRQLVPPDQTWERTRLGGTCAAVFGGSICVCLKLPKFYSVETYYFSN